MKEWIKWVGIFLLTLIWLVCATPVILFTRIPYGVWDAEWVYTHLFYLLSGINLLIMWFKLINKQELER